ncbi:hypothetical protein [Corallococcus llansteffanensis]|uniref:Lipoprotein n=1 Tax=Corallococcus llansteffanensis TaxID=2316731 RepID=A0A3A8NT06_9BACT|nr:hypothetical protein [Corallococcus llansteffanensis]RKH46609.1 hypothetical protein D7V93_34600 [Corallococcus llansteffanensis]
MLVRLRPSWTVWLLGLAVLLQGCGGAHARKQYQLDSATNTCRHQPASCAQAAGQEAVLPTAVRTFATAGGSAVAALKILDDALKQEVTTALEECANHARTEVILERHGGTRPTPEECMEELRDIQGRTLTRAMKLGEEMHRVALRCAAEKLNKLRPGGFSLEPTYLYDQGSGKTTWLSAADVDRILRQGRMGELKGSLVPDVVLHAGHPDQVQAVYDFKFPCVDITRWPDWRRYPSGHPYAGYGQDEIYREAFNLEKVLKVVPWLGAGP